MYIITDFKYEINLKIAQQHKNIRLAKDNFFF